MSGALRFNENKPKLGYFMRSFPRALEAVARVKEFGANKYNEGNWKKGGKPDEEYLDSMCRHLNYLQQGEVYDQDSGCHHLGHAIWNLCAWLELNTSGPLIDSDVFYERMAYWAAEKAKREAEDADVDASEDEDEDADEDASWAVPYYMDDEPTWTCEACGSMLGDHYEFATVCGECGYIEPRPVELLKDAECPVCGSEVVWELPEGEGKECECGHVYDLLECPQCGETNYQSLPSGGFECYDCGEIFGLPIVPADGEGDVYIEEIVLPENDVRFYLLEMPEDAALREKINDIVQALMGGAELPRQTTDD
jgi:ribosomal protein S27AE